MKGISPVIATVIIVAVAIALAIAVALWITGITSTLAGMEKLEVVNAYTTFNTTTNEWTVHIIVKNTGTRTATIDGIFINNQPLAGKTITYTINGNTDTASSDNLGITVDTGQTVEIQFNLAKSEGYTNGQTISIIIHTSGGGQYPATITLP